MQRSKYIPKLCQRLNINYKCLNIFQYILFGNKYTLYHNLMCKIGNSPTHGNAEGTILTCLVIMLSLLNEAVDLVSCHFVQV
jgi:hypothetical protein